MTNFQQNNSQGRFSWLTPERALVVLPIAVGITFALILGGVLLVRFQSTIDRLTALEKERVQKKDELPLLKIQQKNLKQSYREARIKTQTLQQLVSGNQSIETLLSQLNLDASAARVSLQSYEPQADQSSSKSSSNAKTDSPPIDPLVSDGVIKEKRLIVVKGPYTGLLQFLRRLERITPLLVISELSVQADASNSAEDQLNTSTQSTMRFILTAYSNPLPKPQLAPDSKPLAPS